MRTTKGSTGGVNREALVVMSMAEAAAIAKSAYMTVEDEEQPTTAFLRFLVPARQTRMRS